MEKYTLITGGASGLGFELSKLFAKDGNNLFLVSSNQKNLEFAKRELEKEFRVKVETLAADLSNPHNFRLVKEFSDSRNMFVNNLVNCAGFGDRTDFLEMDIDKQIKMVELNCNAPMYLMHTYLKEMVKQKEGRIMNIASIAGFFPGPFMCTYHATKSFLINISESVERELKGTGVTLTTICPGPFESGFVAKAGNDYTFTKMKPISGKKVADISYKAFNKGKRLVVIDFGSKLMLFGSRLTPRRMNVNVSAKQIKKDA